MSPHTAHNCEGDPAAGLSVGDDEADDDTDAPGLSFGESLLLVDSDRWRGRDARLCLGPRAVLTESSVLLGKCGSE